MINTVCKEVIITNLERRGKGTESSPIRCITQVYEKDGTLIAENDPSPETYRLFDLIHFARWCAEKNRTSQEITPSDIELWQKSIKSK